MTIILFSLLLFLASVGAGGIGALVGLGGGVLIVPILTVGFGFNIHVAIGASIVSVIATSSSAAAAYVRDHLTNIRLGMFLEVATTCGAVSGALLAGVANQQALFLLFGVVLLISTVPMVLKHRAAANPPTKNDRFSEALNLASTYPDQGKQIAYGVTRVPLGFGMMYIAGLASGLLGIGSGTLKVLAMDTAMGLPIKVSSATSNFMIGVTAAASAGIYYWRGDVAPVVAGPVALGVLIGATGGARLLPRVTSATVRWVFVVVLALVAIEMLLRGFGVA